MKKIFAFFLFIVISSSFIVTLNVNAQTTTSSPNKALNQAERMTDLKSRADTEISRRITALNKILGRLSTIKHLTDAQKVSFTTQIQNEITTLTSLKTKIDADTDLTTLKTDVQSIVTAYRVYALFIPQIQLVAAADRELNVADEITTLAGKLQTRIQNAQTAGNNTATLQADLTDMQNKIADAKTHANNAIALVTPLTPSGYPGNKGVMQNARALLQTGHQDLVAAGKDAKSIIQGLRDFKTTPEPTK